LEDVISGERWVVAKGVGVIANGEVLDVEGPGNREEGVVLEDVISGERWVVAGG